MDFIIITIFPEFVESVFRFGIIRRACEAGKITYLIINPRDFATDKHKSVDDVAYGGGPGMVLKCEPIFAVWDWLQAEKRLKENRRFIHLTPRGTLFTHKLAQRLAKLDQIILLCGRYEGIDERVVDALVDEEISIGDYVLSGGDIPAMVVVDAVSRLAPGIVGDERSVLEDSFASGLLDYPHYTRPAEFRGMKVPEVLLSGNHEQIRKWRLEKAIEITKKRRPDLWEKYQQTLTENAK